MSASYPGAIKSFTTKVDNVDSYLAAHMNDVQAEIAAIETALGINLANIPLNGKLVQAIRGTPNTTVDKTIGGSHTITRNAEGDYTINWANNFADANYIVLVCIKKNPANNYNCGVTAQAVGTTQFWIRNTSSLTADPESFFVLAIGT